jgi:hypothetical protein
MDTVMSALIYTLQSAIAALGIYVTMFPLRHHQLRHKRLVIALIVILWIAGLAITGFQQRRNSHEQASLQASLEDIQKNTKQPPRVNISVPPAQVNIAPQNSALDALSKAIKGIRRQATLTVLGTTVRRTPEESRNGILVTMAVRNSGDLSTTANIRCSAAVGTSLLSGGCAPEKLSFAPHDERRLSLSMDIQPNTDQVWGGVVPLIVTVEAVYGDGYKALRYTYKGRLDLTDNQLSILENRTELVH